MLGRAVSTCARAIYWSFGGLFLLTPLVVCPQTHELFEFPKLLFVYALTVVIVAAFLIKRFLNPTRIPKNPLGTPTLLYVSCFLLSTAFSIHAHTSIFGYYSRFHGGLLSLLAYISLFFIYVVEFRGQPRKVLTTSRLLLGSAFIVSLYGVFQHLGIDQSYWIQDSAARVFSTLGQPNWLAAWLVMVLPLSWVFYLQAKTRLLVTGYWLLSITLFASFWFTYSLSGVLGFLVTVLVFAALAPKEIIVRNKRKVLLLITSYLLLAVLQPGLFAPRMRSLWEGLVRAPQILAATAQPLTPGGDTAEIRGIVWRGALNLWRSSPKNALLGTGPETFAYAFLPFRPEGLNQTSEWDFLYNKAHNEYIDILCGTGLLGLGPYLFLVGSFLWWGMKAVKSCSGRLLPALLAGWASLLVTNFFGFAVVPTALLFWLYPAICLTLPPHIDSGPAIS